MMDAKTNIKGLKQSGRLVMLEVVDQDSPMHIVPDLCRQLANRQINIAFMNFSCDGALHSAFCCIEKSDRGAALSCIEQNPCLKKAVRILSDDVGLLSIYPHQASLNVLGIVLQLIQGNNITAYGFASSIAALTFVFAFDQVDNAATSLASALKLVPEQIVKEPTYRLRQTMPPIMSTMPSKSPNRLNDRDLD